MQNRGFPAGNSCRIPMNAIAFSEKWMLEIQLLKGRVSAISSHLRHLKIWRPSYCKMHWTVTAANRLGDNGFVGIRQ